MKVIKYKYYCRRKGVETYNPRRRVKVSKEQGASAFLRTGNIFLRMGGTIYFISASILMAIRSFFGLKRKVRNKNIFGGKYVEFKVRK